MSISDEKIEVPSLFLYPEILPLEQIKEEIIGQFCYIIKQYPLNGISVLIKLNDKNAGTLVRIGDWDSNPIHPDHPMKKYEDIFMKQYAVKFLEFCMNAKIEQIQFYLSCQEDSIILVDARTSINNMVSPGYIKDIFGKLISSQQIIDHPQIMSKEVIEKINEKVIIKPSLFKTIIKDNKMYPLYALK